MAIENLCCNVMNEALMIEKLKFPTQLKDLFMEQGFYILNLDEIIIQKIFLLLY